jgi:hypothetical protein
MFKWLVIGLVAVIAVAVGAWWFEVNRTESALLAQPVYRVLKQHNRPLFQDLFEKYRLYQRGEESHERFVNFANAEISKAATISLGRASQDSVLALVGDMVTTAKKLQASPDDACFRFWFPNVAGAPDVAASLDASSQARTLDLMADVIRSAADNPAPPPDAESVRINLANVVNAIYEQYGTDAQMLAHADDPRADRSRVCTITISLYERILQLPPAEASDLIRTMAPTG